MKNKYIVKVKSNVSLSDQEADRIKSIVEEKIHNLLPYGSEFEIFILPDGLDIEVIELL